jgi:serine protease Do
MRGKFEIRRSVAVLAIVCASIGGGLVASYSIGQHGNVPVFVSTAQAATVEPSGLAQSFSPVVKRTAPAVVNISTTKVIKASDQMQRRGRRGQQPQQNPFFDDPFFRQFFGDQNPFNTVPRDRRESSLGSGVIVNADGYVLTNNHVVEGATTVKVTLADRRELTAKVVGTDPQTDIAVVKIDATKLPVLALSSAKPEVGDLCLAIGDPFGIGQTVTMGIVSATGRNLGGTIEAYEDFIQTDAAINPGNSGGALINTRGELIGINTAILSGSGANAGVGFAIPVTMARNIMDQLIRSGKVTRGYIGAWLDNVTPDLAKAWNLPSNNGVAITKVDPDTPAAKAGLKAGDVVTEVNGEAVVDTAALRLRIASMAPGATAKMHVIRNGAPTDINVTLGERPAELDARGPRGQRAPGNQEGTQSGLEGVSVDELTPEIAQQLGIPNDIHGVVITDVDQASAAADAGLEQGDVIEQVNRQPVRTVADFNRLVKQTNGSTVLLINRGGGRHFVAIQSK